MKLIFFVVCLSPFFAQAAPQTTDAPEFSIVDAHFAELASGRVVNQCDNKPNCRSAGMGLVLLSFKLSGCADRLGEVAYRLDEDSNTLYVSAINMSNARSSNIKCIRQPTKEVQLIIGGTDESTTIVNLIDK